VELGGGGDLTPLEALHQLVRRCDEAPIFQGNEGMRGPLLAEAKTVLLENGIETSSPPPGATYQAWLSFRGAPMVLIAEDRQKAVEVAGVLLKACREAVYVHKV